MTVCTMLCMNLAATKLQFILLYVDNKKAEQPVHPGDLISIFFYLLSEKLLKLSKVSPVCKPQR